MAVAKPCQILGSAPVLRLQQRLDHLYIAPTVLASMDPVRPWWRDADAEVPLPPKPPGRCRRSTETPNRAEHHWSQTASPPSTRSPSTPPSNQLCSEPHGPQSPPPRTAAAPATSMPEPLPPSPLPHRTPPRPAAVVAEC